jgi:hypothetical protein
LRALRLLLAGAVALGACGTAPAPTAVDAPRNGVLVWAVGDGATGSDAARGLADRIAADRPRRVLYLGDVYELGTARDFRERFATVYGALARRMDPTPGNHDWPRHATGYDPYWRRVKGRALPHHYGYSAGGWRVVSLNSETPRDAAQLRFLRRELRRSTSTCVLAFMHRPRFNAGEHADEQRDVEPLWRPLRGRAVLLLGGHDHNLQRFRPVGGTTQLVIGAGGRGRYAVDEHDPRLAFSNDRAYGALRILLRPGRADLRIVRADGRVLDRSTVRCR